MNHRWIRGGCALLAIATATHAQEKANYSVDAARSKIVINVSKEGAFKAFGHDHVVDAKEISGQVQFDPQRIQESTVRLRIPTKAITVVDPGESDKDRHEVQATMEGEKVLNVAKFPEITFTSSSVSAPKKTSEGWELTLAGKLKLHGVEKQVTLPLHVHADNGEVRAEGDLSILQTDYEITPVKVGGGTVKVKDKLKMTFNIIARKDH